jgi:hypothetical protein
VHLSRPAQALAARRSARTAGETLSDIARSFGASHAFVEHGRRDVGAQRRRQLGEFIEGAKHALERVVIRLGERFD